MAVVQERMSIGNRYDLYISAELKGQGWVIEMRSRFLNRTMPCRSEVKEHQVKTILEKLYRDMKPYYDELESNHGEFNLGWHDFVRQHDVVFPQGSAVMPS